MKQLWALWGAMLLLACSTEPTVENATETSSDTTAQPEVVRATSFSDYHNGDIIFQVSASEQSEAIQLATGGKYSHMGIVNVNEVNGKVTVLEASDVVKITPIEDWIAQGVDGHYVVKRLKNSDEVLGDPMVQIKMVGAAKAARGAPYDPYFEWSNDRIYCSELVWKVFSEGAEIDLAERQQLGDLDLSSEEVQAKLQERYEGNVPMDEPVVTPMAIFDSEHLDLVYAN